LYWKIGHLIVEDEQKGQLSANYGSKLLNQLALSSIFRRLLLFIFVQMLTIQNIFTH